MKKLKALLKRIKLKWKQANCHHYMTTTLDKWEGTTLTRTTTCEDCGAVISGLFPIDYKWFCREANKRKHNEKA